MGTSRCAPATEAQRLDDSQKRKQGPDEEAKGDCSLSNTAPVRAVTLRRSVPYGHRDRAGKPEDRGDPQNGQRDDVVIELHGVDGRQADVGKDE